MEDAIIQNAVAYASRWQLQLAERLGFGIHGIIYVGEGKSVGGKTAIKAHREVDHLGANSLFTSGCRKQMFLKSWGLMSLN